MIFSVTFKIKIKRARVLFVRTCAAVVAAAAAAVAFNIILSSLKNYSDGGGGSNVYTYIPLQQECARRRCGRRDPNSILILVIYVGTLHALFPVIFLFTFLPHPPLPTSFRSRALFRTSRRPLRARPGPEPCPDRVQRA